MQDRITVHHIGTITIQGTQADIAAALARMSGRKP